MKKIGIAFFYHESHSFTPMITELEHFNNEAYLTGDDIFSHYKGTKTEVGGFIDFLQDKKYEVKIVPLLCASAVPSGIVTNTAYEKIKADMICMIQNQLPLDGMLLALHGAMVVEGTPDPEEKLLGEIRTIVGDHIPIATTLDLHANISEKLLDYSSMHFGFKTYPHIDMYDQGLRAAKAVYECLFEEKSYEVSFRRLPMLLPSLNMRTETGPMKKMIDLATECEKIEGIKNVSVFGGFPYADTKTSSASIIIVGTNNQVMEEVADRLAEFYWQLKDQFLVHLPTVEEGLELALSHNDKKPVVLADISDNPLSCGSGDTTELLRAMIQAKLKNALFGGLYDLESIHRCYEVGEGKIITLQLGGKVTPEFGQPVQVEAEVIKLSDGVFYNSGPFNQHLKVDLKAAAHIKIDNLDVVLIGRPMSANDPEMFRHLGINLEAKRILGLKVKNHFRAAFDPIIGEVIYVDAPGVSINDLKKLAYKDVKHPIWPLDNVTDWNDND